ncbi:nitroreductase family protein, partial [Lactobacillus salivarius]|nr:nitroreductase family protein [Ligilactobacillus salivarius]
LGLDPERYVPVMAIAVGKADSQSTDIKSTRYSVDDVIEFQ